MALDLEILEYIAPMQAIKEACVFERLMAATPASERHDWMTWQHKLATSAVSAFQVLGTDCKIYVEPLSDADGRRFLHIVGLEGEGFIQNLRAIERDIRALGEELGVSYYSWQTGNTRLGRALARLVKAKPIATVYRVEA